jgi:hypothetical protein
VRVGLVIDLPLKRPILAVNVHHLEPCDPFARRAALVNALVPVGIETALVAVDANVSAAYRHDADVAILHLGFPAQEIFLHLTLLRHPVRRYSPNADESNRGGSGRKIRKAKGSKDVLF